eukprot:6417054-Prymnesium_polylepis.1
MILTAPDTDPANDDLLKEGCKADDNMAAVDKADDNMAADDKGAHEEIARSHEPQVAVLEPATDTENAYRAQCRVAMSQIMDGYILSVHSFVLAVTAYIAQDIPEDREQMVRHVSTRASSVLHDLFYIVRDLETEECRRVEGSKPNRLEPIFYVSAGMFVVQLLPIRAVALGVCIHPIMNMYAPLCIAAIAIISYNDAGQTFYVTATGAFFFVDYICSFSALTQLLDAVRKFRRRPLGS